MVYRAIGREGAAVREPQNDIAEALSRPARRAQAPRGGLDGPAAINDVEPRGIAEGNYTLTCEGRADNGLEAG